MYDKIGGKIKVLTKAIAIIGIVASVIYGIVLLSSGQTVAGIIYILIMPFLIWISSFVLYGFGELVEKVCNIEKNIRQRYPDQDADSEQNDYIIYKM